MAQEEAHSPRSPRFRGLKTSPSALTATTSSACRTRSRRSGATSSSSVFSARVLQAADAGSAIEPTGHAVRMDALHLIREASEFADVLEPRCVPRPLSSRTEQEVWRKQTDVEARRRGRELPAGERAAAG